MTLRATITLMLLCSVAAGETAWVRLRDEAFVEDAAVTLGQVADVAGDAALAELVVAQFSGDQPQTVTRLAIREKLTEAGVNWGKVSLSGHTQCRVRRLAAVATSPTPSLALSNPTQAVEAHSPLTLREKLTLWLEEFTASSRDDLRITLSRTDEAKLRRVALEERWEFEPSSPVRQGRLPLTARRYEGDAVTESLTLTVDVSRRVLAVVTTRSLDRGAAITEQDVEVQEVFVSDVRGLPLTEVTAAVGQHAGASLRAGSVVYAQHLRSPVLVSRGDVVTVRSITGSLVLKTLARAQQDGTMGQLIELRNERSRGVMTAKVVGPLECVAVGATQEEQP